MYAVAVTGTGDVYAWGDNKHNQVGVAILPSKRAEGVSAVPVPRLLPGLIGIYVAAVSCGAGHTVVCARDGRVFSWYVWLILARHHIFFCFNMINVDYV